MKKQFVLILLALLCVTVTFAQGKAKKGKTPKGVTLIKVGAIDSTALLAKADSLAKLTRLDSLNRAIAARNAAKQQVPAGQNSGLFSSADEFGDFLKNPSSDTTKRGSEFKEAMQLMYGKKTQGIISKLSKAKVYTLPCVLAGWQDVAQDTAGFVVRNIPGVSSGEIFVAVTGSDVYFFSKRGGPLKEGEVLEMLSSLKDKKLLSKLNGTLSAIRQELTEKMEENSSELSSGLSSITLMSDTIGLLTDRLNEIDGALNLNRDMRQFYFGIMDKATRSDFQKFQEYLHSGNDSLVNEAWKIAEKYNLNKKADTAMDYVFYGKITTGAFALLLIIGFFMMRSRIKKAGV